MSIAEEIQRLDELRARFRTEFIRIRKNYRAADDKYASMAKIRWDKSAVVEHRA